MGELILVTGPPGAGKSSVSAALAELFDPSALVAGDDFFRFLRRGSIAPWLVEAHAQNVTVTEAAAVAAGRLCGHCTVVYDGVVGPWLLPTFVRTAEPAQVHYIVLLPPLDVCLERVRTRRGHGFTDLAAARHMYEQFSTADIGSRHVVAEHRADAAELAAHIGRGVDAGSFVHPTA